MSKKILGSSGVLAGLGLLGFMGYHFLSGAGVKATSPPGAFQGVISPDSGPAPQAVSTSPAGFQPTASPVPSPAAPPAVAPVPPSGENAAAPAPPAPTEEPGLLAGKFRRYKDARSLLSRIQRQNIPAFVRKEGNRYGVWAGPFATNQEAVQAKKKLQMALKISSASAPVKIPFPSDRSCPRSILACLYLSCLRRAYRRKRLV